MATLTLNYLHVQYCSFLFFFIQEFFFFQTYTKLEINFHTNRSHTHARFNLWCSHVRFHVWFQVPLDSAVNNCPCSGRSLECRFLNFDLACSTSLKGSHKEMYSNIVYIYPGNTTVIFTKALSSTYYTLSLICIPILHGQYDSQKQIEGLFFLAVLKYYMHCIHALL